MKFRELLMAAACAAALLVFSSGAEAGTVLYDASGFLQGQESFSRSFDINGPGTLTVTLSNISWPEKLSSLNFVLSTAKGLVGTEMSEGTEVYQVTGGRIFANWFGQAQGPLNLGVYGMKIEFTPSASAVPLPTSIGLLLSGIALLAWQRRGVRRPDDVAGLHPA